MVLRAAAAPSPSRRFSAPTLPGQRTPPNRWLRQKEQRPDGQVYGSTFDGLVAMFPGTRDCCQTAPEWGESSGREPVQRCAHEQRSRMRKAGVAHVSVCPHVRVPGGSGNTPSPIPRGCARPPRRKATLPPPQHTRRLGKTPPPPAHGERAIARGGSAGLNGPTGTPSPPGSWRKDRSPTCRRAGPGLSAAEQRPGLTEAKSPIHIRHWLLGQMCKHLEVPPILTRLLPLQTL